MKKPNSLIKGFQWISFVLLLLLTVPTLAQSDKKLNEGVWVYSITQMSDAESAVPTSIQLFIKDNNIEMWLNGQYYLAKPTSLNINTKLNVDFKNESGEILIQALMQINRDNTIFLEWNDQNLLQRPSLFSTSSKTLYPKN